MFTVFVCPSFCEPIESPCKDRELDDAIAAAQRLGDRLIYMRFVVRDESGNDVYCQEPKAKS